MKASNFIGIDPASVCGFAYYFPFSNEAHLFEVEGNPIQQWDFLQGMIQNVTDPQLCIEMPTHFRNAVTTRSYVGRYGYLKWSSFAFGYPMREVNLNSARHLLGCKTKEGVKQLFKSGYTGNFKITDNHTDALAIAIYGAYMDGHQEIAGHEKFVVPKIEVFP